MQPLHLFHTKPVKVTWGLQWVKGSRFIHEVRLLDGTVKPV